MSSSELSSGCLVLSVELERSSSAADVGPSFTALPARDAGVFDRQAGVTLDCRADGSPTPEVTWVTADGRQVTSVPGIRLVDKGEIRSVEARRPLLINIYCLISSSDYLAYVYVGSLCLQSLHLIHVTALQFRW